MESFKANFIIFGFIVVLAGLLFWAVRSVGSKSETLSLNAHIDDVGPVVSSDPLSGFTPNENSGNTGASGGTENMPGDVAGSSSENNTPIDSSDSQDNTTPIPTNNNSNAENAELTDKLQGLITDKIYMKKGSRGTRVGTVQKFLVAYGVSVKIDNDYGDTTVNGVKKFQTDQKLTADGQAGPSTYQKMIDWLNKN